MYALEIIELRLAPGRREDILDELMNQLGRQSSSASPELLIRLQVGSDLAVHVRHVDPDVHSLPSRVGLGIAASLRELGPVKHSIWVSHRQAEKKEIS